MVSSDRQHSYRCEESSIYISRFQQSDSRGEIIVNQLDVDGKRGNSITLKLPQDLTLKEGNTFSFIYFDKAKNYCVYGQDTDTQSDTLLIYSPNGELIDRIMPAPSTHIKEYRLQGASSWKVDLDGNVYLPTLGPTGLHIIQMIPG